jgi:hypothetical protein
LENTDPSGFPERCVEGLLISTLETRARKHTALLIYDMPGDGDFGEDQPLRHSTIRW